MPNPSNRKICWFQFSQGFIEREKIIWILYFPFYTSNGRPENSVIIIIQWTKTQDKVFFFFFNPDYFEQDKGKLSRENTQWSLFCLFCWFPLHSPWIWQNPIWGKYSTECWITTSFCWLEREAKGCSMISLITSCSIYSIPKGIEVYPHLLKKECEKNLDVFQNHHRG